MYSDSDIDNFYHASHNDIYDRFCDWEEEEKEDEEEEHDEWDSYLDYLFHRDR